MANFHSRWKLLGGEGSRGGKGSVALQKIGSICGNCVTVLAVTSLAQISQQLLTCNGVTADMRMRAQ
jgi:hypothetical protein